MRECPIEKEQVQQILTIPDKNYNDDFGISNTWYDITVALLRSVIENPEELIVIEDPLPLEESILLIVPDEI